MARVHPVPMWQRALILLSGTVVGVVVILALHWGRPVLIPVALAVLLTFLLNPLVRILERRGFGRTFSVVLSVSMVGIGLTALGWMVTREVAAVLGELPQYTTIIKTKIKTLRQMGSGPFADRFAQMVEEISNEIQPHPETKDGDAGGKPKREVIVEETPNETVVVRSESVPWMAMTGYLGSAIEVLATLAFALILLVFFLLGRDDLRDRIVLLAGRARLALTSKELEDVTDRISRYLSMVGLINGGFGVLLTIGLLLLGVPYALLWGFVAAGLRFIPYIGPWVGAIFPIVMSLATSQGWWQPIAVFGFVMVLELVSNNIVEPLLFGHSTGVSPTALLILAAFWLYLWGPIGLVLSAPIAVCLVALGKSIPQLAFLSLLLGDTPALRAHLGIYQRLMLGDQHEAVRLVAQHMKEGSPTEIYDEILIPALNCSKRDLHRGYLTDADQKVVQEGVRESLRQIERVRESTENDAAEKADSKKTEPHPTSNASFKPVRILGCPATDDSDSVGLEMLRQLLDPLRWELEVTTLETLTSELVARVSEDPPAMVCIAALPPGGMAHARYLCKRLRDAAPEIQIIVCRWGQKRGGKSELERLEQAGANFVTTSVLETQHLLESRLPLLPREPLKVVSAAGQI